jgi:hypothetical protein
VVPAPPLQQRITSKHHGEQHHDDNQEPAHPSRFEKKKNI